MTLQQLTDSNQIAEYLRQDIYLHLYGLGDLDEFYRPYTTWYGNRKGGEITALALLYHGEEPPVLLGLSRDPEPLQNLLRELLPELPLVFYAHLSPGVESVFADSCRVIGHGLHQKLALRDRSALEGVNTANTIPLTVRDAEKLLNFYQESYPGNWFNPRMLETRQYFGLEKQGKLVSAAGVHVYSPEYGVAALGNIATLPNFRGQGLAARVTARCCLSLLQKVDHIGLNLLAENIPARACYSKLGFEDAAQYGEYTIRKNPQNPGKIS